MKIIHHRYLNTNTMSKKKKKNTNTLHLYPPLIIINFQKRPQIYLRECDFLVCVFVSQKKKKTKKGNCPTLLKRVLCVV